MQSIFSWVLTVIIKKCKVKPCVCVFCRSTVSSPVCRSVAIRWGACRKLWKPSGWTGAGWIKTCPRSKNGSNNDRHPGSAPLTCNMSSGQQQCLHYCRTLSLNSLYPGQSFKARGFALPGWTRCSFWYWSGEMYFCSGWLWLCVWQEVVGCWTHSSHLMLSTKPLLRGFHLNLPPEQTIVLHPHSSVSLL